jgi:hypothetical protein
MQIQEKPSNLARRHNISDSPNRGVPQVENVNSISNRAESENSPTTGFKIDSCMWHEMVFEISSYIWYDLILDTYSYMWYDMIFNT